MSESFASMEDRGVPEISAEEEAALTDRLSPQREAEIAAAVAELDADRALPAGAWTSSKADEKSVLPPEQAFVVEDVMRTEHLVLRSSVGVFGDERHARFTALARTAVPELLAELAAVRKERDEARARVLNEAADKLALALTSDGPSLPGYPLALKSAVRELRRMADEAVTR